MLPSIINAIRTERLIKLAGVAYNLLRSAGGFTLRADNGDSAPSSGYVVSLSGNEVTIPENTLQPADIVEYFVNRSTIRDYFGGWIDNGLTYLDVSVIIPSLESAIQLAKENSQIAIYDLSAGRSIKLETVAHAGGFFADSGVQAHSAGPIFPLHIVAVVNFGDDSASYRAEGLGSNLPAYSFQWSDKQARAEAHKLAENSARRFLAQQWAKV